MQSHSLLVNLRKMRKEPTCPISFPPPHKDIDENRILMRWASPQNVELLFFFVDRAGSTFGKDAVPLYGL